MSQIVQEDVATLTFSAQGESQDQYDVNDPQQFEFGNPHDESMDLDAIKEEEEQLPVIEEEKEATETCLDDSAEPAKALNFEEPADEGSETSAGKVESKEKN